jgi:hypothetical protein
MSNNSLLRYGLVASLVWFCLVASIGVFSANANDSLNVIDKTNSSASVDDSLDVIGKTNLSASQSQQRVDKLALFSTLNIKMHTTPSCNNCSKNKVSK